MATDITVPTLGESVAEATVAKWFKTAGEAVEADEPLVELETDKVTVEVNAPVAGVVAEIMVAEGTDVAVGTVLGRIEAGAQAAAKVPTKAPVAAPPPPPKKAEPAPAPKAPPPPPPTPAPAAAPAAAASLSPAVRRLVEEHGLDPAAVPASGKDGRLTKGDVLAYVESRSTEAPAPAAPPRNLDAPHGEGQVTAAADQYPPAVAGPQEERVRMSRLRKLVAGRLKEAQNTAAMLTTFNEADMTEVMAVRARYRDGFEKKHGVRLGFMSFFAKASIAALRELPAINAEIAGDEIVYKNHYDIGVAVGSEHGLVVPVLRDADRMSFADIEKMVTDFGRRARDGKLTMDELQGGTFTITNGGVFGSLMSTPILNPPQSGILGMHKIQQRAMVMPDGAVQARPMMYLALSYDHRIVDGREAVTFLVRLKECIENPERIMLDT